MKIIISYGSVKRELYTPFALCIETQDLKVLIQTMQGALAAAEAGGFTYGWLRIDPSHPCDAPPNTKPLQWHENLPMKSV